MQKPEHLKIVNVLSNFLNILYFSIGCIPWPCFNFLGTEDPHICQHYVHAPNDIKIEVLDDPNPIFDTIVVSWRPSYYGM